MSPRSFVLAVAVLVSPFVTGTAAAAEKSPEPLALKLSSAFSPVHSDVIARMRVEPDARSRELLLEWFGEDLSGGSTIITLDGARAARTHSFPLKRLSAGAYTVVATLRLADGTEVRRQSYVTVVGIGGPDTIGGSGGRRPVAGAATK